MIKLKVRTKKIKKAMIPLRRVDILPIDRLDEEIADPWVAEEPLNQDVPVEDAAERDPERRDLWQPGVLHHISVEDPPRGQALGLGVGQVVLAQDVDHEGTGRNKPAGRGDDHRRQHR
jgi:hypothetical protein